MNSNTRVVRACTPRMGKKIGENFLSDGLSIVLQGANKKTLFLSLKQQKGEKNAFVHPCNLTRTLGELIHDDPLYPTQNEMIQELRLIQFLNHRSCLNKKKFIHANIKGSYHL